MNKLVVLISVIIFLSGCVSTKNLQISQQDLKLLNPNNIALTSREKPDFSAMTAGKVMFALVSVATMGTAGNDIVEENEIEDPANYIRTSLANALKEKYGFKISEPKKVTSSKSSKIVKAFPESDLILDVETINWSFVYFPTDWDNYRVIYSVKLRLIETKTKNIVAEGFCSRVPEEDDTAPSYDELLANKAERLKQELTIAADKCIGEFKTNIFSIQS